MRRVGHGSGSGGNIGWVDKIHTCEIEAHRVGPVDTEDNIVFGIGSRGDFLGHEMRNPKDAGQQEVGRALESFYHPLGAPSGSLSTHRESIWAQKSPLRTAGFRLQYCAAPMNDARLQT